MRDVGSANLAPNFERLIAQRRNEATAPAPAAPRERLPTRIYGIMALTTMLTFATLTTGYELLFVDQLIAPEVAAN